jgi:hypothetical protein
VERTKLDVELSLEARSLVGLHIVNFAYMTSTVNPWNLRGKWKIFNLLKIYFDIRRTH